MLNLKQLAFDYDLKQFDIAGLLGVDQSTVSHMMNGRRQLKKAHYDILEKKFGAETLRAYEVDEATFFKMNGKFAQVTVISPEIVEEIKEETRNEVAEELKETVILTPEILTAEGIDIKKELKAGTLEAEVKPTQDVLPTHHAKVYTETDEMSPEIEANDPVFVRFLSNKRDFIDGRMYFVDLDNGSVVRWVVGVDADHIRLISMKDENIVPFDRVRSISEVVAITKRPKTLPKHRITMEDVIAHKDAQIDMVNSQIDTMLEQQGRLIGIIEKKL